ncbi:mRNA splicing protein prp28, partial [Coemansia sp. RSA 2559]
MKFTSNSRKTDTQRSNANNSESEDEMASYVNPFAKASSSGGTTGLAAKTNNANEFSLKSQSRRNGGGSKEPLSVEEALRIKKQLAEPDRPVFLSKQQRAQVALEKRQREANEMRRRREETVRELSAANEESVEPRELRERQSTRQSRRRDSRSPVRHGKRYHDRDDSRSSSRHQSSRRARDSDSDDDGARKSSRAGGGDFYRPSTRSHNDRKRSRSPSERPRLHATGSKAKESFEYVGNQSIDGTGDRVLTQKEREAIRKRYLEGEQASLRSTRKQSNRKVMFDWDASEDTSRDISDLYENRHQFQQLFGRGKVAGVDEAEQERLKGSEKNAMRRGAPLAVTENILGLSQTEKGRMERVREKRRQRELKTQWDERHWSEKPLSEMRDRDWRIFREDYSISCKGGSIPHPYRS